MHGLACWFFFTGINVLALLTDFKLTSVEMRLPHDGDYPAVVQKFHLNGNDIAAFSIYVVLARQAGMFLAFIISLLICIRQKWFWFNAFLAYAVMFLMTRFDLDGWAHFNFIFFKSGLIFGRFSRGYFITNGSVLLMLGLLLFFLKPAINFIAEGQRPEITVAP
jgi:hypothetical protein